MRNPERLDGFYDELKRIHKEYFPDWRYGQLCSNFFSWCVGERICSDIFFPEDDKWIEWLRQYVNEIYK